MSTTLIKNHYFCAHIYKALTFMISRRNIRIKVLHTIYELSQQDESHPEKKVKSLLSDKIDQTAQLLAANIQLIYQLSQYVLIYANQRASKMMPSKEDLEVNTKLAGNIIAAQLAHNTHFNEIVKKHHLHLLFEEELLKRLFISFAETEMYKVYISTDTRTAESEKAILIQLFEHCIQHNEYAQSFFDENYLCASYDQSMIPGWMDKVLMSAASFNFHKILSTEKHEFAQDLAVCYYEKKDIVFELIEPKLVNWDAERVAIIDLIILHLGICELLYFPEIPVKVTINEYIDIAKSYSTPQSGQFVNGLLDNVRKELTVQNMIIKKS